jgi:hypothetical protein
LRIFFSALLGTGNGHEAPLTNERHDEITVILTHCSAMAGKSLSEMQRRIFPFDRPVGYTILVEVLKKPGPLRTDIEILESRISRFSGAEPEICTSRATR